MKVKRVMRLLFTDRLWELNVDGFSRTRRNFVKFIKLTRITFAEFAENRMGFQCVALSYFVALSIIPFAAFLFAFTDGIGLSDKLSELVFTYVPADRAFLEGILDKAENIILTAHSGPVGLFSALAFIWTILWLMFQTENVFNNVWKIRKIPRKIYKRFTFYLGALFLSPFVVLLFGAGIALYSNITQLVGIHIPIRELTFLATILGWLVFYAVAVLILTVMYEFIPAVKVKFRSAFIAALVSGVIFTIFQYLYLETQVFIARLNGVYGVLAAIPLFMMYVNYSWQIIIYGAQLSYGIQNVDSYHIPEGRLSDFTPYRDRLKQDISLEHIVMEEDEK